MTRETQPSAEIFNGTGFESIRDEIISSSQTLSVASSNREDLEAQRDAAVAAAAAPFAEGLEAARREILEAETKLATDKVVSHIKGIQMEPITRTALDIMLRSRKVSVADFAEGIKNVSVGNDDRAATKTANIFREFRGFEALRHSLAAPGNVADSRIGVGFFRLNWAQEFNMEEGSGSMPSDSPPVWHKYIDTTCGFAGADDLTIEYQDISPEEDLEPVLQPRAIVLALHNAVNLRTDLVFERPESRTKEIDLVTQTILDARPVDKRPQGTLNIDWIRSKPARDFSMQVPRLGMLYQSDPRRFIAWGDELPRAIQALATDDKIPVHNRRSLNHIYTRITET